MNGIKKTYVAALIAAACDKAEPCDVGTFVPIGDDLTESVVITANNTRGVVYGSVVDDITGCMVTTRLDGDHEKGNDGDISVFFNNKNPGMHYFNFSGGRWLGDEQFLPTFETCDKFGYNCDFLKRERNGRIPLHPGELWYGILLE